MILSYKVCFKVCFAVEVNQAEEVIKMKDENTDDFYDTFENYLDDDEISPEEEGFMRGFTEGLLEEE